MPPDRRLDDPSVWFPDRATALGPGQMTPASCPASRVQYMAVPSHFDPPKGWFFTSGPDQAKHRLTTAKPPQIPLRLTRKDVSELKSAADKWWKEYGQKMADERAEASVAAGRKK